MSWLITPRYLGAAVSDPDAQTYLRAVEAADGSPLEVSTTIAINAFVVGCKTDGIWNAIKACCILAGARTLAGALVPLVGTAPTNFNFVTGDYNRKTGPLSNGSSKYLNTNRAGNADPQNDMHLSVFCSQNAPNAALGASNDATNIRKLLYFDATQSIAFANNNIAGFPGNMSFSTGFLGVNRISSSAYSARVKQTPYTSNTASTGVPTSNILVFADGRPSSIVYGLSARLAFYSIGESLNLELLDARVTALINAINAAF